MEPGDPVLLRSVLRGQVRWAFPHHFVGEDGGRVIFCGTLDDETANTIRREGKRVLAERPWPTGWEDWRPPSDWEPLSLPEGWDVVDY